MRVTKQHAQSFTLVERREFVATSGGLSFTGAEPRAVRQRLEIRSLQIDESAPGAKSLLEREPSPSLGGR